jgi:hypothetical protein
MRGLLKTTRAPAAGAGRWGVQVSGGNEESEREGGVKRLFIAGLLLGAGFAACAEELPENQWVDVESKASSGTSAGLVYLPEQKQMRLWGPGVGAKFEPATRAWSPVGAPPVEKNGCYADWAGSAPVLPVGNYSYWVSHQMCYLPEEKKVLYFLGGLTFTYDPQTQTFENKGVPFGKAPPDVMLGSLAWNPVRKEAILFGGGFLKAFYVQLYKIAGQKPQPDAWTSENWDRRGTWAYDPATNAWRALETASKEMYAAYAEFGNLEAEMKSLWGAARGVAFEYGDLVYDKKPAELAEVAAALRAKLEKFARETAGKGDGEYEKGQFAAAAGLLTGEVAARLGEAADALRQEDGWKAFQAVNIALDRLTDAREMVACAPPPRHYARLVTDPGRQVMVLWGGDGEDRSYADTWLLHLDTHRWERLTVNPHPPTVDSSMVAMDYDPDQKVVVLAHPEGGLWTFDAGKKAWQKLAPGGTLGIKGRGTGWMSLEYATDAKAHVLLCTEPQAGAKMQPFGKTQMLRLNLATAQKAEAAADVKAESWRRPHGASCQPDQVGITWKLLPKTQAEYREKVAAHKKVLAAVPENRWVKLDAPYAAVSRDYGSFCYDYDRDEIVLWGGGHSAYQGNQVSQYDLAANLWMESWNPEFSMRQFGAPPGFSWGPFFRHPQPGLGHGYCNYQYRRSARRVSFGIGRPGEIFYDPDRMLGGVDKTFVWKVENAEQLTPYVVDMCGAPETLAIRGKRFYGGPFWAWKLDPAERALKPIPGSTMPDGLEQCVKGGYDAKRQQLLYFSVLNKKDPVIFALDVRQGKWETRTPVMDPAGSLPQKAVGETFWTISFAAKYDGLLFTDQLEGSTWFYSSEKNTLRKLPVDSVKSGNFNGLVYSPRQDLFYALGGPSNGGKTVWVLRLKL